MPRILVHYRLRGFRTHSSLSSRAASFLRCFARAPHDNAAAQPRCWTFAAVITDFICYRLDCVSRFGVVSPAAGLSDRAWFARSRLSRRHHRLLVWDIARMVL